MVICKCIYYLTNFQKHIMKTPAELVKDKRKEAISPRRNLPKERGLP
jgi:hypothetical protein